MNNPRISIIVPVYKAESFLHKCVESILNQTERDIELILVDDGSPDRSGEICDDYGLKDSRVRVIHQKNAGVSAARNRGIQEARGAFVGFVDSDDWVMEDMYMTMLSEAGISCADIVMCDVLTVYEDGTTQSDSIPKLPETCNLNSDGLYPELMLEFAGSACRCIYKRSLINEKKIQFPEGLKFSEDRIFNIYAMGYANNIRYIKQPFYLRYVNMASCVNSYHKDHFQQAKFAAEETQKAIRLVWNDDAVYQKTYLRQFVDASCSAVRSITNAGKQLTLIEKIRKLNEICNDSDLQNAFLQSGYLGENGDWIQKKRIFSLCWYNDTAKQKVENIKEVYTATGVMGVVKKCVSKLKK